MKINVRNIIFVYIDKNNILLHSSSLLFRQNINS